VWNVQTEKHCIGCCLKIFPITVGTRI
jgi:hypothetical protein